MEQIVQMPNGVILRLYPLDNYLSSYIPPVSFDSRTKFSSVLTVNTKLCDLVATQNEQVKSYGFYNNILERDLQWV